MICNNVFLISVLHPSLIPFVFQCSYLQKISNWIVVNILLFHIHLNTECVKVTSVPFLPLFSHSLSLSPSAFVFQNKSSISPISAMKQSWYERGMKGVRESFTGMVHDANERLQSRSHLQASASLSFKLCITTFTWTSSFHTLYCPALNIWGCDMFQLNWKNKKLCPHSCCHHVIQQSTDNRSRKSFPELRKWTKGIIVSLILFYFVFWGIWNQRVKSKWEKKRRKV